MESSAKEGRTMQTCRVACISIFVLMVCAGSGGAQTSGGTGACPPFETRAPNAPDQRPAFPGQTRACAVQSNVAFDVVVLATGLEQPWIVRRHRRDQR
jgi:glucose/arabinose dehydrogenase